MNARNEERFSELAMKTIARRASETERAELEALLASDPALRSEYQRLQADVRLAKELVPLAQATAATEGELPAYARGRLQTKVRQTLGRPESQPAEPAAPRAGLRLRWRWWLGLALAAAVIGFLVIPPFLGNREPVIELAMLDAMGATRGATNEAAAILSIAWQGVPVQQFSQDADLIAWEATWPELGRGLAVKIVYDRTTGELRVLGRSPRGAFTNTIPVDTDLPAALAQAKAYVERQGRN